MAIALRSAPTTYTTNHAATTMQFPTPSGIVSGDLLVAVVSLSAGASVASAPGWTQIPGYARQAGGCTLDAYYRIAGSEFANYIWTLSAPATYVIVPIAYSGCSTAAPLDVSAAAPETANVAAHATPQVTAKAGDWVIAAFADLQPTTASTWTVPTGLTRRCGAGAATSPANSLAVFDTNAAAAAGSAQYTSTASAATTSACMGIIALSPAPTGPSAVITTPPYAQAMQQVTVGGGSSTDSTSTISTYQMAFGDGSPPTTLNAPTASTTHAWTRPGTYAIGLTVTDAAAATASTTTSILITPLAPTIAVQASSTACYTWQPLTFTMSVTTPGSYPVATYALAFSDGTNITIPAAVGGGPTTYVHAYSATGVQSVNVTATDASGAAGQTVAGPVSVVKTWPSRQTPALPTWSGAAPQLTSGKLGAMGRALNTAVGRPAAYLVQNTNGQSLGNGQPTALSWDTAVLDTHGGWSANRPTRYYAPWTGWYVASGYLSGTSAQALGTQFGAVVYVNSSQYMNPVSYGGYCTWGNLGVVVSPAPIHLNAGDWIEIAVLNAAGNASVAQNFFDVANSMMVWFIQP